LNSSWQQLSLVAAVLPAIACGGPTGTVCTDQFVTYQVVVTNPAGAPISDANLAVTVRRTGQRLMAQTFLMYTGGTYPLIDDGARTALRQSGDAVRVVASKAAASIEADYLFDVPGGCHVHKVAGPDTLVLP
jgi:hypothetical protein